MLEGERSLVLSDCSKRVNRLYQAFYEKPTPRQHNAKVANRLVITLLCVPFITSFILAIGNAIVTQTNIGHEIAGSDLIERTIVQGPSQEAPTLYEYVDMFGRDQTAIARSPIMFPWHKVHKIRTDGNGLYLSVSAQQDQIDRAKLRAGHGNVYDRVNWKRFSKTLDPLLSGSALIGFGLFIYASVTKRKYVWKNDHGLSITTDSDSKTVAATLIPWECLKDVKVINGESKSPVVELIFDHGTWEGVRWHDIVSTNEPGEFINALRTFAPNAVQDCKFPTETALNKIDDNTYTKLWFKYYSKGTERQRPGQLTEGDRLCGDRFEVLSKLGGGGQGTAYLATDNRGAQAARLRQEQAGSLRSQIQEVVLKEYILPVHRGQQVMEQSAQRLRQEADILRKIDHPSIVKLLDEFTEDHRGYLVMEYVQGKQLKTLVGLEGPQPETLVRDIALQVCDILEYLHTMDPPIIHRDLTPDNLILQDNGTVKLVDFNVAHQLESAATATVVGKHAYIPPEQFRGKPTPGSDVYAFGCTLHYLLTGHEPEPLTVSQPRLLNTNVSEEMNQLIAQCTNMDATKRPSNIAEIKSLLSGPDAPVAITLPTRERVGLDA